MEERRHRGRRADDTARLAHLRVAIAAARGGLADGCGYEWIDTDREHARRHLVKIYAQAAGLHADSDPATALALYDTAARSTRSPTN